MVSAWILLTGSFSNRYKLLSLRNLKHLITFQTKLEFDIEIDLVPDIWSMSVMMMFKLYCLHYNPYWPNSLLENHDLPNSTSLNLIFPPQSRFRHFLRSQSHQRLLSSWTSPLELRQRWSRPSYSFCLIQRCGWTFSWLNCAPLFARHGRWLSIMALRLDIWHMSIKVQDWRWRRLLRWRCGVTRHSHQGTAHISARGIMKI